MAKSQGPVQLLEEDAAETANFSIPETHQRIDVKIRSVFSLQEDEELTRSKVIAENIPSLYEYDSRNVRPRLLLILQIGIAFMKFIIFWSFFLSWLTEIKSQFIEYSIVTFEFLLPTMLCSIVAESIWRARYHYAYLSFGVVILFDGKPWYKRKFFYLFVLLCSSMFALGLYNDVGEWNWDKLKITATAGASSFIGLIMTVRSVLDLEESSMCKLHEFIRSCGSKQESDDIFSELLVVNETVFKAYILNRKYKMREMMKNVLQNELKEIKILHNYNYPLWYFNKEDIAQFMMDQESGGSVQSAREYLNDSKVKGFCGRHEMFWAIMK